MKILKWILIILVIMIMAVAAFLAYMGVFSPIKLVEARIGPYTLVYEEYVGPYSGVGPVLKKVYTDLKADGIETSKAFGIYLNDPNATAPDKLKSYLGCVLEAKDLGRAKELGKKYQVMQWELKDCLVAEFPIRNDLSYMFGPLKVYPHLDRVLSEKGYEMNSCMELYDMPAKKIFFIFGVDK